MLATQAPPGYPAGMKPCPVGGTGGIAAPVQLDAMTDSRCPMCKLKALHCMCGEGMPPKIPTEAAWLAGECWGHGCRQQRREPASCEGRDVLAQGMAPVHQISENPIARKPVLWRDQANRGLPGLSGRRGRDWVGAGETWCGIDLRGSQAGATFSFLHGLYGQGHCEPASLRVREGYGQERQPVISWNSPTFRPRSGRLAPLINWLAS